MANRDDDAIGIVDAATLRQVATVEAGSHPFAVGLTPDGARLFALNVLSNDVSVIDTGTRQVIATIAVGNSPYGVAFSADGPRAWVTNQHAETVSVIDTATLRVVDTVAGGAYPEGIAVAGGRVVVVSWMDDCVHLLDAKSGKRLTTIDTGRNPRGFGRFLSAP